jgi:predicted alpha/beta superfamily hydrolase
LISWYVVIRRPGVFGRLLIESPSLYVSDAEVLKEAQSVEIWPSKIYMGIGTHEGLDDPNDPKGNPEAVQDVRRLEHILRDKGVEERRLMIVVEEGGMHYETDWARRLPAALEFLYRTGNAESEL